MCGIPYVIPISYVISLKILQELSWVLITKPRSLHGLNNLNSASLLAFSCSVSPQDKVIYVKVCVTCLDGYIKGAGWTDQQALESQSCGRFGKLFMKSSP